MFVFMIFVFSSRRRHTRCALVTGSSDVCSSDLMTQVVQKTSEFATANGAYRAARIAFVQALWHREIVEQAYAGFVEEMATLGFGPELIERFETPGAFEIPLHAQTLARTGRYAAIVGAAFVVDGGKIGRAHV